MELRQIEKEQGNEKVEDAKAINMLMGAAETINFPHENYQKSML